MRHEPTTSHAPSPSASLRPTIAALAAAVLFTSGIVEAMAADPASAVYSHDDSKVLWLVHISDTHIGAEVYDDTTRFNWFVNEALAVLQPFLVVNSGDLVDGSPNSIPASGQDPQEWATYRDIVDDAGVPPDLYYDLAGNHDYYGSVDLVDYMENSVSGSTYSTKTHAVTISTSFGDYFVYGAATPGDDGATFIEHPEFSTEELADLEAELLAHDGDELILVFGHHRPHQPENSSQAMSLIAQHGGFYFHGHSHGYDSYLHDGIVVSEVDTLGKGNINNVAVVAIDNNAVSYAATDSEDPWPFIVPTAPVSPSLLSGDPNPYTYQVCNTGTENPVRALVFDVSIVSGVTVQCNDATPVPLEQHPQIPQLWTGTFDASALPAGEATLTFTAYGGQVRTRQLTIELADVECPEPVPPLADGGVADGGADGSVHGDGSITDGPLPDRPLSDSTVAQDATPQPDGSLTGGEPSGGCSCRLSRRDPEPLPWRHLLLLAVVLAPAALLIIRRKRRLERLSLTNRNQPSF